MDVAQSGTFLTISTSPPMLSSPSLSRSIAVWKVNFHVRIVCIVTAWLINPSELDSYLYEALPICEVSFPCSQGGENPGNVLDSRQLTMHYARDVEVFGAHETLYGIVAGIYDLKGEGRS
jgi:hypothetical protein